MLFLPRETINNQVLSYHQHQQQILADIDAEYWQDLIDIQVKHARKREDIYRYFELENTKWLVSANSMRNLCLWLIYEANLWHNWVKRLFGKTPRR